MYNIKSRVTEKCNMNGICNVSVRHCTVSMSKTTLDDYQVQGMVAGHQWWSLGMEASQAQDCWSEQSETQCCAEPPHALLCRSAGFASVRGALLATWRRQWLPCPFTTCCKHQWCERGSLNFSDTLFIGSVLLLLVSAVDGCQVVRLVRLKTLASNNTRSNRSSSLLIHLVPSGYHIECIWMTIDRCICIHIHSQRNLTSRCQTTSHVYIPYMCASHIHLRLHPCQMQPSLHT